mmetsp:Transcript_10627/g.10700  ORF Transcript_10627/g.10700 Transcript_10627/m.10700 type:complete len:296 (-) Transcript_10627:35-922(-)
MADRVFVTGRGDVFKQLWQHIPMLENFYFEFENTYDPLPLQAVMINAPWFPVLTVILYMILCYVGTKVMANYKAFDLKYPLAFWNLFLSLFSFYGALRTAPHLIYNILYTSFESTICTDPDKEWGMGATGLAVQLFIISKFPELIDTVFIVLKKKPLIFLHWYHHVTVLLYCWNAYVTEAGAGLWFIVMNYTVHAIMYFYYFLQTLKLVPKWFPSYIITLFQISQMFIGIYVTYQAINYYYYGGKLFSPYKCNNNESNLFAGTVMYSSYALLFVWFALERFLFNSKPNKHVKKRA